ncbi:lamin tail domain-containing protein [Crocosphaera sp.]|uniref:lamin tail domain-containing protein n=1 Tax=Crocosphaera sp. TaxID=2729996 RepID=UPI003F25E91D|nr:lamin tail domain-containing protein [Crocosphaera sp.]
MTAVQTLKKQNLQSVLSFDGQNDYIEIKEPFENNTVFTISLWINPAILNSNYHGFIGKQGDAYRKPGMWVSPSNNGLHYDSYDTSGNRYSKILNNFFESKDKWVHIAWVKENTEYKIYRDGELFATESAPVNFYTTNTSYWLGRVDNFFVGKMAEVRIWNKARSQEEIKQDMNHRLTGKEEGLMAYYPLNGDVLDHSSNNNNGTIHDATWTEENLDFLKQKMLTGGNDLIHRQFTDSASNFYLVDTNNAINVDGYVNYWKIWADNNLPVQLVIFRQDGNNWSIVGRSEQVTPKTGLNELTLSSPIAVKAGDCVGLYYPNKGSVSAIKHKGSWALGNLNGTVLWSYGAEFNAFTDSGYRTYSVQVNGTPGIANVEISEIVYHGHVKRTQSDEYIEIRNSGNAAADLSNWKVTSIGKDQLFAFPEGTSLAAGQMIRVYTNEVHQESGGFSFGSKTAIWNDKGDMGKLLDAEGNEVSSFSYGDQAKSENSVDSIKAELGISGLKVNISETDIKQLMTPQTKVSFLDAFRMAMKSLMEDGNLSESPLNILQELPGEYGLSDHPNAQEMSEKMKELLNNCGIELITDAEDPADEWAGKVMCDETGESYGTNSYWIFKLSPSQFTDMNYAVVDKAGVKPTINWGFS